MENTNSNSEQNPTEEAYKQTIEEFFCEFTSFRNFLTRNKIDPNTYISSLTNYCLNGKRYIRTSLSTQITKSDIVFGFVETDPLSQSDPLTLIDLTQLPGPYLNDLYSQPISTKINTISLYKKGHILGIDFSSALVVKALDPKPNETIQDMCCCPGAKQVYIADIVKSKIGENDTSRIFGNDINAERLKVCKALVTKSGHQDVVFLTNQDAAIYQPAPNSTDGQDLLFDKILVDVECTHDGSFKHMTKFLGLNNHTKKIKKPESKDLNPKKPALEKISNKEKKRRQKQKAEQLKQKELTNKYFSSYTKKNNWSKEDFEERVQDEKKQTLLEKLQEDILWRGWQLLKPGGTLVYSTCSLSETQNENIISKLIAKVNLQDLSSGEISDQQFVINIEVPFVDGMMDFFDEEFKSEYGMREGSIKNTIRFDPTSQSTSGMFLAKISKKKLSV